MFVQKKRRVNLLLKVVCVCLGVINYAHLLPIISELHIIHFVVYNMDFESIRVTDLSFQVSRSFFSNVHIF